MKRVLLSMTAVTALAIAMPAAAQGYGQANAGGGIGISNRIAQLDARLSAGVQAGEINRTEAQQLRPQLRELRRLERQYSVNGLTQQERMDLQQRIRMLRQDIRIADGGRYDRDNRYGNWVDEDDDRDMARIDRNRDGWDDRDIDRDGRWDDDQYARIDRNRDGWDDRDIDRDGRWDDDIRGQGGPYEEAYPVCDEPQQRGGLGGVIDSVLGRGGSSCLSVGQRVSGNLSAVPYEYRNQYRDGGGVYYRSDGRQIYQIDARTNTVLRIYSMDR
jgi:hypothetical protein